MRWRGEWEVGEVEVEVAATTGTVATQQHTEAPAAITCMVLPPKLDTSRSVKHSGNLSACTGTKCANTFSMGTMTRAPEGAPTTCKLPGVIVEHPSATKRHLAKLCDTSADIPGEREVSPFRRNSVLSTEDALSPSPTT